MSEAVNLIQKTNPEFKYYMYDDNECLKFIKEHFDESVANAYMSLIPGAYKADLWRYCVLYKEGGIYMDIKYIPHNDFRLISLTEQEHFVLDADHHSVYNALMVCKPNNPILFKAINAIVRNVKVKYYGSSCLEPTGPQLLGKFFPPFVKNNFPLNHETYNNLKFISMNGIVILKMYNNYYSEMGKNQKSQHYSILWGKRSIYLP
jgi:mannosyltransferase OCH1-like enzyme